MNQYRIVYQKDGQEPKLWANAGSDLEWAEALLEVGRQEGCWGTMWIEKQMTTPWERMA